MNRDATVGRSGADSAPATAERRGFLMRAGAGAGMAACSLTALYLRQRPLQPGPAAGELATQVPERFAGWSRRPDSGVPVVPSDLWRAFMASYDQVFVADYQAAADTVSLCLARITRPGWQRHVHAPEVCYPAQGYEQLASRDAHIVLPGGPLAVRHILMRARSRSEAVTFWYVIGEQGVVGELQRRLAVLRANLSGQAPLETLVRVSSPAADPARAFAVHEGFVAALCRALPPAERPGLLGQVPAA